MENKIIRIEKMEEKFEGIKVDKTDHSPCSFTSQAEGKCDLPELPREKAVKKLEVVSLGDVKFCENDKCLIIKFPKIRGPRNSTDLLSNYHIENTLKDLSEATKKDKKTYPNGPGMHIPFEMCDFVTYSESGYKLRDLNLTEMQKEGYKSFFCVLNTDEWSGGGLHWVCVFECTNGKKCTVEYFNSSGNSSERYKCKTEGTNESAIKTWFEKHLKKNNPEFELKLKDVITKVLQFSETECGVWCLWYILSRLKGHPPNYFLSSGVTDKAMIEYARTALFV